MRRIEVPSQAHELSKGGEGRACAEKELILCRCYFICFWRDVYKGMTINPENAKMLNVNAMQLAVEATIITTSPFASLSYFKTSDPSTKFVYNPQLLTGTWAYCASMRPRASAWPFVRSSMAALARLKPLSV